MDVDGSGDLTFEEFRKGFINFGLKFNLRETKCLFRLFDVNGDGTLSYAEFVAKLKVNLYNILFILLREK
jgi:Ca2+-binding EF-hand superfamily protein